MWKDYRRKGVDLFVAAAKKANLEVVSMGVSTPSEVGDTALADEILGACRARIRSRAGLAASEDPVQTPLTRA